MPSPATCLADITDDRYNNKAALACYQIYVRTCVLCCLCLETKKLRTINRPAPHKKETHKECSLRSDIVGESTYQVRKLREVRSEVTLWNNNPFPNNTRKNYIYNLMGQYPGTRYSVVLLCRASVPEKGGGY